METMMSSDLQNVANEIDFYALALKSINAGAPGLSVGIREHMARSIAMKCRDVVRTAALRSPGLDRDGERMRAEAFREGAAWMREEAAQVAEAQRSSIVKPKTPQLRMMTAVALDAAAFIRALPLAHEEKAGC